MTEQEAEMWGARLMWVWSGANILDKGRWSVKDGQFRFEANYTQDVSLYLQLGGNGRDNISLDRVEYDSSSGQLIYRGEMGCFYDTGQIVVAAGLESEREKRDFAQFAIEWLPFFRRGCWLSGCPIEATAHERAEWGQDFSREELETWNLKM